MPLRPAIQNARDFVSSAPVEDTDLGRKWLMRELCLTDYNCIEYPHVTLRFLAVGVLQIFGNQKQPVIHRFSIKHIADSTDWTIEFFPDIDGEKGKMDLKITDNYLVLTPSEGQQLHLVKTKFKAPDNSK